MVCTLPGAPDVCPESLQGAHSPRLFGFGLDAPYAPSGEEEGVKRIKKIIVIIIKNYLRKKKASCWFQTGKPVLLVFLAATNSGGLAQLFFVLDQYSGSL